MNLFAEPDDHAIGRSRGGLSTKIHSLVDGKGRPLVLLVAPGQGGDAPMFTHLMNELKIKRRNVVERNFNTFKQWRALATRYDKLALTYRGGAVLRAINIWLTALGDTP